MFDLLIRIISGSYSFLAGTKEPLFYQFTSFTSVSLNLLLIEFLIYALSYLNLRIPDRADICLLANISFTSTGIVGLFCNGYFNFILQRPRMNKMSDGFKAAESTFIRTWLGPGFGLVVQPNPYFPLAVIKTLFIIIINE